MPTTEMSILDGTQIPPMNTEDVNAMSETETSHPVNRQFLASALDNCTQEQDIFMIRFNGLQSVLKDPDATDEQVRKAYSTLKRAMADFRVALKSIPGKL